jgi:Ca2+-binding EF-hand superfamily protein
VRNKEDTMKDVYDENEQDEVCAAGGVDPNGIVTYFTYRDVVTAIGENRTPDQVARLLREVEIDEWGGILTESGKWSEYLDGLATSVEADLAAKADGED